MNQFQLKNFLAQRERDATDPIWGKAYQEAVQMEAAICQKRGLDTIPLEALRQVEVEAVYERDFPLLYAARQALKRREGAQS